MTRKQKIEKMNEDNPEYIVFSTFTDKDGKPAVKGSKYESSKDRVNYLEKMGLIKKV